MDKSQAVYQFWSGFGVPAYDENTAPDAKDIPSYPYITYTQATDALDAPVPLTANIWDRSTSWERVSKLADKIAKYVGEGGFRTISIDGGYLLITQGHPFTQRMPDEGDDMIRRVYVVMMAEFLTAY